MPHRGTKTILAPRAIVAIARGFESAAVPAGLEVQSLIREIGLIDEADLEDEAFPEIELEIAQAIAKAYDVVTDKEDLSEETTKRAVTLVPGLPAG